MALTTSTLVGNYLQTTFSGSTTPTDTIVDTYIDWATAEIERRTGQKFEGTAVSNLVMHLDRFNTSVAPDAAGNYVSINPRNDALFQVERVHLEPRFVPILTGSASTIERNTSGVTGSDSWETLTEQSGSGGDYLWNAEEATLDFVNNGPRLGKRSLRLSFSHGYATVPNEVQKLATMLAAREVLNSSYWSAQNGNFDSVSVADISLTKANNAPTIKQIDIAIERQWEVVGRLYSQVV